MEREEAKGLYEIIIERYEIKLLVKHWLYIAVFLKNTANS